MKFRKVVFILLATCISFSAFLISGCKENGMPVEPKNCEALVEATLYNGTDCNDFIAVCNSPDEFKEVCLNNGYDFFDASNRGNNFYDTSAGATVRQYTDEYFTDKAFVVCAYYRNSYAGQYLIEDVEVTSGKLTLYIRSPKTDTADAVVNEVFLIAAVDKSLVADVTDTEYVLR